ncbi:MAG: hypothetical protein H0W88_03380 [Parachlamydiaceae bacterium]|nr:hypothetical protein [Parachlamydiaceae bacterium]
MDLVQKCTLVSNPTNWELIYKDKEVQPTKDSTYKVVYLVISIVAWPIFFLAGALALTYNAYYYFKATFHQSKIIEVLTDDRHLLEYEKNRIHECKNQINKLKFIALPTLKMLNKPNELGLPNPIIRYPENTPAEETPEAYYPDFPWNDFINTNFLEKSNDPYKLDKKRMIMLEHIRLSLLFLSRQITVLSNSAGNDKLEAIKKIAELSFVKIQLKKEESKKWVFSSILEMIPLGHFWNTFSQPNVNDRLKYEKNKQFLLSINNLNTYEDLVDAHNKLVTNNSYLLPYIKFSHYLTL